MTGYGIGRAAGEGWEVSAELKTVNHRFLDLSLRLPRNIMFLEQTVRDAVSARLRRGHVDVFLSVLRTDDSAREVRTDEALARSYRDACLRISEATGLCGELTAKDLMGMEGVLTLEEREMDQERLIRLCAEAVNEALDHVIGMREKEGAHLAEDLRIHMDAAAVLRDRIRERAPGVVLDYRARLESKLQQLLSEAVDPARLAQEVALMADRCAIDEEILRLGSHLDQMGQYLQADQEIGKKMDFLVQEMNREANTIGSKASDAAIAQMVVDLKSEIEKLREQIQNVE